MQLKAFRLGLLLALAAGSCTPASAGVCVLVLTIPGALALAADGTRLGSQEAGGLPATFTVASVGSSTVAVAAPTVTQSPAGYNASTERVEVAYFGAGILSSVTQSYTTAPTSFAVPNLISAVAVTVNNRIINSQGFAAGAYATRTVITCS